jgi:hypothetical protein
VKLFTIADGARHRFGEQLAISDNLEAPTGEIRLITAHHATCDPQAPMDVFLHMLERDEATSPSSLEGLFEDLEKAHQDGFINLNAQGLSLTEKGRELIRTARAPLAPLNDMTMRRVDLYAQEVADGRLSLRDAIQALGAELHLQLRPPGQEKPPVPEVLVPDAGRQIDTELFDPLLLAVSRISMRDRTAVVMLALYQKLKDWGLSSAEAQSVLQYDIRCLRAFGASLSHGLMDIEIAKLIVEGSNLASVVNSASTTVADALLEKLAGPKRKIPPDPEEDPQNIALDQSIRKKSRIRTFIERILSSFHLLRGT